MGVPAATKVPMAIVSESRVDMYRLPGKLNSVEVTIDSTTGKINQKYKSKTEGEKKFLEGLKEKPGRWTVETLKGEQLKLGYIKQVINLPPKSAHKWKGVMRFGKIPKRPVGAPRVKTHKLYIGFVRVAQVKKSEGIQDRDWFGKILIKIRNVPSKRYPIKFTFPLRKGESMTVWTNKAAAKHIQKHYDDKTGDKLVIVGQPLLGY